MAPMLKRGTVPIDSIVENLFVRIRINEDHVLHLASLIEGETKLPPIKVARDGNRLIDGRHRLAAMKLLEKKAVDVEWVEEADTGDILVNALQANIGGSLPPTNSDIIYAIRQMLEVGLVNSVITKQFSSFWPPAVIRKYIANAQTELIRSRTIKAKSAVLDEGLTVADAATRFKIKPEQLKNALTGKKTRKTAAYDIKAGLSHIYKSRGQMVGAVMKKVQAMLADGDISWNSADDILTHCEVACKSSATSIRDWRTRLEAQAGKLKQTA